jgi:hypothetical protein
MQWTFGEKIHFSHSIATLPKTSLKKFNSLDLAVAAGNERGE